MAETLSTSGNPDSCRIGTQPTRFHLFLDLPTELRLQIWERALQPRLVNIDDLSGDRGPAILRVNRESRSVSRPKYKVFRATRVRDNEKVGFFINPSIDAFSVCQFVEDHNRWQIVAVLNIISCRYPPWLNNAQRLAISLSSEVHSGYPSAILEQTWRALDKQFPDLKELVIIMDSEEQVKMDELVTIQPGKDKLGQIVQKFEDGLQMAKGQGLCKVLKLSFMRKPGGRMVEDQAPNVVSIDPVLRHFNVRRKFGRRVGGVRRT